jgi:enoyl-CoA hydratase
MTIAGNNHGIVLKSRPWAVWGELCQSGKERDRGRRHQLRPFDNAGETTMIDLKTENGIALVTMQRGKANALDFEFCDALARCFHDLRTSETRAVVLTGQGNIFSAGVDLIRLGAGGAAYVHQFMPALQRAFEAVFFFPKPVIAAINGHAIAGGCVLACCADRRIMARGAARIGVTEILVGVPFPTLAFEIMRAAAGRHVGEVTLGGATYEPQAALPRGLIDEIAAAETLLPEALAAAQKLAALSPAAFGQTKKQLRQDARERVDKYGPAADAIATDIWASAETLGYVRDYVARTLKKG